MISTLISKLSTDERGATMVEYGIAVVVAVLVGTAGLITMANQIDNNMNAAATQMADTDSD
jgi:Flp pilus assembly pilin Flp